MTKKSKPDASGKHWTQGSSLITSSHLADVRWPSTSKNRKSVMAVTAARIAACHYGPYLATRRKIMDKRQTNSINTNATTRNQVRKPSDGELTEDQLNQITGGTVPSIPIPPPSPGIYAIGQIEARFPR